jgi:signal transduction histidine kinase
MDRPAFLEERIQLLYKNGIYGAFAHLTVITLLMGSFWKEIGAQATLILGVSLAIATIFRLSLCLIYRSNNEESVFGLRMDFLYAFSVAAAGFLWGIGGSFLAVSPYQIEFFFYVFVVGCASIGALATLAPFMLCVFSAIVPALLPIILTLLVKDQTAWLTSAGLIILLIAMLGVGRNINRTIIESLRLRVENTQLLAQLKQKTNVLESTQKNITDGMIVVSNDGVIISCNPVAYVALGIEDGAEVCNIKKLLPKELISGIDISAEGFLKNLVDKSFQYWIQGGRYWVLHCSIIDGVGAVLMLVDLTKQKKIENMLELARDEAQKSERVKSQFLASASHDLRQPAVSLDLLLTSLKRNLPEGRALAIAQDMGLVIKSLSEMADTVLQYFYLDSGKALVGEDKVVLDDLFDDMNREFGPIAENKGIDFRVRYSHMQIHTDKVMFDRLMRNLVSNSVKYTSKGGVLLACRNVQGKFLIQVWDTGSGISAFEKENIFKEFYRVNSDEGTVEQSTGLGLTIVSQISQALGFVIELKSNPKQGSVFSINIPNDSVMFRSLEDRVLDADNNQKNNVVVIGENQRVEKLLQRWGYSIVVKSTEEDFSKDKVIVCCDRTMDTAALFGRCIVIGRNDFLVDEKLFLSEDFLPGGFRSQLRYISAS